MPQEFTYSTIKWFLPSTGVHDKVRATKSKLDTKIPCATKRSWPIFIFRVRIRKSEPQKSWAALLVTDRRKTEVLEHDFSSMLLLFGLVFSVPMALAVKIIH